MQLLVWQLLMVFSLVWVVCNNINVYTNTLLSLTREGERKQWSEIFPPMPTPRQAAACVTTEQGSDCSRKF